MLIKVSKEGQKNVDSDKPKFSETDKGSLKKAEVDTVEEQQSKSEVMEESECNKSAPSQETENEAMEEEIIQLKENNVDLRAQLDKLKKVLAVMDKQLKLIKQKK